MFKKTWFLWVLAFVLTLSAAIYQRATGPTYPFRGKDVLAGQPFKYRFERSHGGQSDHLIQIQVPDGATDWKGALEWKRYKTEDAWTSVPMALTDGKLMANLPGQPPAGKLEYHAVLEKGSDKITIPRERNLVIRFKGQVPPWILIPHVIAMFSAMFLATRAGIQAFVRPEKLKSLVLWTVGLFSFGGMFLGPVVQKYAFGAFWTGWPYGTDLTDNKTAIAWLVWLMAVFAMYYVKKPARMVMMAVVVMWGVYLIPHSMFGSELNYKKLDQEQQQLELRK